MMKFRHFARFFSRQVSSGGLQNLLANFLVFYVCLDWSVLSGTNIKC